MIIPKKRLKDFLKKAHFIIMLNLTLDYIFRQHFKNNNLDIYKNLIIKNEV